MGRLPSRISEREIERFFKGYGHLREINVKNGYGFVVGITEFALTVCRAYSI